MKKEPSILFPKLSVMQVNGPSGESLEKCNDLVRLEKQSCRMFHYNKLLQVQWCSAFGADEPSELYS